MTKSLLLVLSCLHLSESSRSAVSTVPEASTAGSQMIQLKASADDAADSQGACEVCLQEANEFLGARCVLEQEPQRCFVWAIVNKCGGQEHLNSLCAMRHSAQIKNCAGQHDGCSALKDEARWTAAWQAVHSMIQLKASADDAADSQ